MSIAAQDMASGNIHNFMEQIVCRSNNIINFNNLKICLNPHSIGSLGKESQEKGVENVTVKWAAFTGTTNGLRIKTWGRPSDGFVKGVVFEHVTMQNVDNPIIIDQNYCPDDKGCPDKVQL